MASKTNELIIRLANTKTDDSLFNPYNQICKNYDITTAPGLRQGNLRIYLDSYLNKKTDVLWVIDCADFYSAKLSGVPLLEPISYAKVEGIFGLTEHFEVAHKNRTISGSNKGNEEIWDLLSKQKTRPLIWNILPFYPHETEDISKRREPTKKEYLQHAEFIRLIISIFKPKTVLALGTKTQSVLKDLNIKSKVFSLN